MKGKDNRWSLRYLVKSRSGASGYLDAYGWIQLVKRLKSGERSELLGHDFKSLSDRLIDFAILAGASRNTDFFEEFAKGIKTARPGRRKEIRLWLDVKHLHSDGSFTHDELLDAALEAGYNLDERQLRRLMKELGHRFKHSRR